MIAALRCSSLSSLIDSTYTIMVRLKLRLRLRLRAGCGGRSPRRHELVGTYSTLTHLHIAEGLAIWQLVHYSRYLRGLSETALGALEEIRHRHGVGGEGRSVRREANVANAVAGHCARLVELCCSVV
jgi:hypothetical protein